VALTLLSGCGGQAATAKPVPARASVTATATASASASSSASVWKSLAERCPALTGPAFASLQAASGELGAGLDQPNGVLSVSCSYGSPADGLTIMTGVKIDRNPAEHGRSAKLVEAERTTAEATGNKLISVPGFEDSAVAHSPVLGVLSVMAWSGNANISIFLTNSRATTAAEPVVPADDLASILRDLTANLRG
jgi:hypothetical protein